MKSALERIISVRIVGDFHIVAYRFDRSLSPKNMSKGDLFLSIPHFLQSGL